MAGRAHVKLPNLNLQRWFVPASPQLAASSGGDNRYGTMQFSSRGGGGGPEYGFPDDDDDETQTTETPPEPPRTGRGGGGRGGGGGDRGNGTGGRSRTIQFQPEDRYWTEYLRIALPIIGLILMLGLFWYWATQIIGDDENSTDDPVATETTGIVETIAAPTESADATQEQTVANTPEATEEEAAPTATEEEAADDGAEATEPPAEEAPTETPAEEEEPAEEFAPDEVVVVNDSGVNLREAAPDGDVLVTLNEGDVLTIVSGPEEAGDYVWYEVLTEDGTTTGWVADEFLDPQE
jgi:hypothetical protein